MSSLGESSQIIMNFYISQLNNALYLTCRSDIGKGWNRRILCDCNNECPSWETPLKTESGCSDTKLHIARLLVALKSIVDINVANIFMRSLLSAILCCAPREVLATLQSSTLSSVSGLFCNHEHHRFWLPTVCRRQLWCPRFLLFSLLKLK